MASDAQYKMFNMGTLLNVISIAVCLALAGCMGADTRGSEAPYHVLISGTPTWTNGIGELVSKKCAVCHQVPRLPTSPTNVPTDLDLRYEKTSGAIRSAEDIAAPLSLGILQHALSYGMNSTIPVRAMPLSYSTPLYTDEITALETWTANVISAENANTSPALSGNAIADGALLFKRHCQGCHGMYGAGGVVNRALRGYTGPTIATYILATSTSHPMHNWPLLMQFATACNTNCTGNQLEAIAAYLATQ